MSDSASGPLSTDAFRAHMAELQQIVRLQAEDDLRRMGHSPAQWVAEEYERKRAMRGTDLALSGTSLPPGWRWTRNEATGQYEASPVGQMPATPPVIVGPPGKMPFMPDYGDPGSGLGGGMPTPGLPFRSTGIVTTGMRYDPLYHRYESPDGSGVDELELRDFARENLGPMPSQTSKEWPGGTKVVNIRHTPCDVNVGRPSPWGNPFKIGPDGTRQAVIEKYRAYIAERPELLARVGELKGKTLGCWCAPEACHADVLAELAEGTAE